MTLESRRLYRDDPIPWFRELRSADAEECLAAGLMPMQAVYGSVKGSTEAFVILDGDLPLAFWGYAAQSTLGSACQAWLLTTPLVEKYKVFFARESLKKFHWLVRLYPFISVTVDVKHLVARNWLEWLGFEEVSRHGRFIVMFARGVR